MKKDMRQLLIASKNLGKIKEIKEILKDVPFEIKSLSDIGADIDAEETGKSFRENAVIKAKKIGEKTGMLTLAEDSGLEVDALNGRPGIYSARYEKGSDLDRINKVLKELEGIPKEKRTARFRSVVALYIPHNRHSGKPRFNRGASRIDSGQARMTSDGRIITFKGMSEGYITEQPLGTNGFGYDPIFFNLDLGKTNGQATFEEKNRVSHRARALKKCKEFLLNLR